MSICLFKKSISKLKPTKMLYTKNGCTKEKIEVFICVKEWFYPASFFFKWKCLGFKVLFIVEWLLLKVYHRGYLITEQHAVFLSLNLDFITKDVKDNNKT